MKYTFTLFKGEATITQWEADIDVVSVENMPLSQQPTPQYLTPPPDLAGSHASIPQIDHSYSDR